jgi:hypothetical protein
MTIAIPKEVHAIMKKYPEIKWSQVARGAVEEKARYLEEIKKEKDPLRHAGYKKLADEGEDAHKLFKF